MKFFLEKQLTKFSSTYYPISFWKIFKKFLEPIQSYENVPFSGPNLPICPKQMFFYTNHYCYFHLPIGPFNCAKFKKKFLQRIQSYKDAPYLGPKQPICPNQNFFRKSVNKPCFFHSCLFTCQKSKSDINVLMKY